MRSTERPSSFPLRRANNLAARLIRVLDRRSDSTFALQQDRSIIDTNQISNFVSVVTVMHNISIQKRRRYICINDDSSTTSTAVINDQMRRCSQFGTRVSSVCGPDQTSESLPPTLRLVDSYAAFRQTRSA